MRFPNKFVRRVGGSGSVALLGSDDDPRTLATPLLRSGYAAKDNVLNSQFLNITGFPIQRVAIGLTAPGASPNIPCIGLIWDELSEQWYRVRSTQRQSGVATDPDVLVPGEIIWFDCPVLAGFPQTRGLGDGIIAGPGSCEFAIVASKPMGAPDGEYVIIAGGDISNTV